VFPATSKWWLDHYHEFRAHLDRYRVVLDREDTGIILDMTEPAWQRQVESALAAFEQRVGREPALLDWDSGLNLAAVFPRRRVFSPVVSSPTLAYLDKSIDVVVCERSSDLVAEARRVASAIVISAARPLRGNATEPRANNTTRVRIESIVGSPSTVMPRGSSGRYPARRSRSGLSPATDRAPRGRR
jgi:hypothetical protein